MKIDELKDKSIAITGGTGSFGKQVTSSFVESDIGEIRILAEMKKNRKK